MHHPLHTAVLLYLLMIAVPSGLLLLLMAGQALGDRLRQRPARGNHGHGEQQPADGVCGVVDKTALLQPYAAGGQGLDDVAGLGQGAREPVELDAHKNVAAATGRQRLAQARADAGGAGHAVVDVDPGGVAPQSPEAVEVGGQLRAGDDDRGADDHGSGHRDEYAV